MDTVKLLKELHHGSVEKEGFLKFSFEVENVVARLTVELKLDVIGRTHFIMTANDSMRGVSFKVFDEIATEDQKHFVGWNLNKIEESKCKDVIRSSRAEVNDFFIDMDIAKGSDLR